MASDELDSRLQADRPSEPTQRAKIRALSARLVGGDGRLRSSRQLGQAALCDSRESTEVPYLIHEESISKKIYLIKVDLSIQRIASQGWRGDPS